MKCHSRLIICDTVCGAMAGRAKIGWSSSLRRSFALVPLCAVCAPLAAAISLEVNSCVASQEEEECPCAIICKVN